MWIVYDLDSAGYCLDDVIEGNIMTILREHATRYPTRKAADMAIKVRGMNPVRCNVIRADNE